MFRDEERSRSFADQEMGEWQHDEVDGASWRSRGAALLSTLLDELAFGIAVVDGRRRLLYSNRIADIQLREGGGVRIAGGVLEGTDQRETRGLQNAIDRARQSHRSYLAIGAHQPKSEIAVVPVVEAPGPTCDLAAIIFEKNVKACGLGLYFFARAYRLTQAEERLLSCLWAGAGVAEAAATVGCAPNTARAHVRSMLIKTAQPSLRALTSRLGRLPPVATRTGFMRQGPDESLIAPPTR